MKPISLQNRGISGFTLVELMIASLVSALVLSSLCGIYFSAARSWERQQGEADALVATSLACERLGCYISQATAAQTYTRYSTNDVLVLTMPLDEAYGTYVPVWTGGKVQMRSGKYLAFYLSNGTGSMLAKGDILWAGVVDWATFTVTPDESWSLYSPDGSGKIAPLRSLRFDVTTDDGLTRVEVTAGSAYRIWTSEKGLTQNATFCLRN